MILDATNIALCKFYPKPPTNRVTINKFSSYTPLAHLKSKCAQINRANNMYEVTLWPSEHIHILSCPPFIPFFYPMVLSNKLVSSHIHSIFISKKFGCKVIAESCVVDNHGPHGLSHI